MVEVTCTRIALLNGSHIFLRAKWFSASFSVTALDFPRSWSCHVTKQEIASVLDTNGDDFFSQARLYLGDGIPNAQYLFQAVGRRPNTMRLSWATTNVRYDEEPRVALCLQEDNATMELIPEFLNVLMDTTVVVKELLARCKIKKSKKVRQLAMRFSASEKARKRSLLYQAPTREGMRGGLDGLVVKSEFPSSTPKFNSSTVSYEPASGRSTPTHPPNLTALDGRAQHECRSPAMEGLKSPRQLLQSVSSSKSPNLGVYDASAGRFDPEETGHGYGHQTPSCFERSNGLGNYVGVPSHGQLKSLPSGHHGINESKREQAQADVQQRPRAIDQHGEAVQIPLTDDREHFLDRAGPSQMKLPVKADAYAGLDRVPPPKHSQEFTTARHGLLSWAQPHTPIRSPPAVDIGSMSRPAPRFHDVAVPKALHQTPASDKGILSHESRKLGMGNPGGSVWINPRKSNPGVKTRSFELSGSKRRTVSHGQEGVIMLSDSEDEDFNNIEVDSGVLDDEGLLGRRIPCAMNSLADEPGSRFPIMPSRLYDSKPFSWRGNSALLNLDLPRVKEERCRSRLESEDRGWQSRSRKRKEWDDAHEDRTDTFAEGKRTKLNGFISEEQAFPCRGSLSRNRSGPDAQAFVPAGTAACIKVESDYLSEQNVIWQSGDHRNDKHASTFHYGSRPQWKSTNPTVHHCSEKFASTFNYESRSQWNTWISEAKTEVTSWEGWIQNGDSTPGGSCRAEDQAAENVVNMSSPYHSKHQDAPLSLKKLERNLDVVDFLQSDSEHFQSPRETLAANLPPIEENRVRERLEDLDDNPERGYTREIGKSKNGIFSEVPQLEEIKVEREVIEVENDGDSDSVEEHVFEPGLYNDDEGMTGAGESVTKLLESRASVLPLDKGTHGRKLPGRRGRPPGIKMHPKPSKSVSQGINNCDTDGMTQSDKDPRKTSSQRFSRPARPVGKLRHSNSRGHPPAAIYEAEKNLVDVDQELQKTVPDSDYYCFDGDRGKDKIKPNQVWALYADIDTMPRTLIRVKEVSMNGSFWVKASWLQPHTASKKTERQKKAGFPRTCGDFEEPKETTIIKVLNCFSHKMEFTPKLDALIQVYPRKGEVWALHKKEGLKDACSDKEKQGKGNEENGNFRLVVILSNCGEERASDILVLRKRTGYRTLWEPGYEKGSLPIGNMDRFSHRVPAYKLTEKDYPDLNNTEIWDIDAAAVPTCQSKVT